MRGPFGMLLIGGGIILIVGLFTGKITFPGATGTSTGTVGQKAGIKPATVGAGNLINVNPDGSCPSGYGQVLVSGGHLMCQKGA